jgi:hypothetical protein
VKPLPDGTRTRNVTLSKTLRETCQRCDDTGYVVVQTRPAEPYVLGGNRVEPAEGACYDEMGPCPFCEKGAAEEFPDESKQNKAKPITSPWDAGEGFWQGRAPTDIPSRGSNEPLPLEENKRRLAELQERMGWVGHPMPGEETPEAPVSRPHGRLAEERAVLPDERYFAKGDA